jgi:hypothetical protein
LRNKVGVEEIKNLGLSLISSSAEVNGAGKAPQVPLPRRARKQALM